MTFGRSALEWCVLKQVHAKMNGSKDTDDVAFVVIGRNEGKRLLASLRSVLAVSSQVVYADSASVDGSPDLARSLGIVVVDLSSGRLNAARGRNEGLAAVREHFPNARLIQFLDGDCILEPAWPRAAAAFLNDHPDVAVVCGRRYEARPQASFYNLIADEEWNTPIGPCDACGGDSMMRLEALNAASGFDPELMAGEEPELCGRLRALGWKIWRLDCPMTEHDANIMRFGEWWRRAVRSGFGYAQVWHRCSRASRTSSLAPQLRSAIFWVVLVPIGTIIAAVLFRQAAFMLAIPIAYAVQLVRIGSRRRGSASFRLRSSGLVMIAKVAELAGALRYVLSPEYNQPIEYKNNPN